MRMARGALGLGSFVEGREFADVTPAVSSQLNVGFPIGRHLRAYVLRIAAAGRVLPDETTLGGGLFVGVGTEWTPDDD